MKIYGIVGWKNSGKTGLVERLVTDLTGRGLSVSTLKHAHHHFEIDRRGKDSWRHREAGAREVIIASRRRWVLISELRGQDEPPLPHLLSLLSPVDLVLIEGYKAEAHPKIECHRQMTGQPLLAEGDPSVRAIASDVALADRTDKRVFGLDDTAGIAGFILSETGLHP